MSSEGAGPRVDSGPQSTDRTRWSRRIAIITAVVYVVSAVFPMAAGLSRDTGSFPRWWGAADVGIAFVLALLMFAVFGLARGRVSKRIEERAYTSYRALIHAIFAMFLVFFLFGDRIVWSQCLTGLAWRYWLLLYSLPAWLAAFAARPPFPGPRPETLQ